jgi:hypothetical protein
VNVLRRWAEAWLYLLTGLLLSVLAWVFLALLMVATVAMVLVVGLVVARLVLPLARRLASLDLKAAQRLRGRGEVARLPAPRPGDGLSGTVRSLVTSRATWVPIGWLALSALLLPVLALAFGLFPLAAFSARLHAWLALRLLVGPDAMREAAPRPKRRPRTAPEPQTLLESSIESKPSPTPEGDTAPLPPVAPESPGRSRWRRSRPPGGAWQAAAHATPPDGIPVRGGRGLLGMRERVDALGGQVWAGTTPDSGFEVRAVIPIPEASTRDNDGR